jgi:hypothetical protein
MRVNEVSDKGSAGVCAGKDWVELFNPGSAAVNLSGYKLHDDKGPGDDDAFTFPPADPSVTVIGAGSYLLLCTKAASRPDFKIGGDDTVTLLDAAGNVVSTSGQLQDLGEVNMTWAYASESGNFQYTNRPTPGASNVISQDWPKVRARLVQQDVDGEDFFSSTGTYGAVVDVYLTMAASEWKYQQDFFYYEVYKEFTGLVVKNAAGETLATLADAGRMRPRGQSTMAISGCMDVSMPYLIDVADQSPAQRLFGMSKFYLRNHMSDTSFMREWSMHRMLRRFGLPYLRTRTVKFHVNEQYIGTYTLMEVPDEDYVFYRSFGNKAVANEAPLSFDHALYKIKTISSRCGSYSDDQVTSASPPKYTAPTNPDEYAFVRGTHRDPVPVLNNEGMCVQSFFTMMERETRDVVAAWLAHEKDCGKMLVEEGLVDRDLGSGTSNDARMKTFINSFLADDAALGCRNAGRTCDASKCRSSDGKEGYDCWAGNGDPFSCADALESSKTGETVQVNRQIWERYTCCEKKTADQEVGCATSTLADYVDVDDFLKNLAVMAVTVHHDSPLGNNYNNWFLATTPDLNNNCKYRMVQYDHNNVAEAAVLGLLCDGSCAATPKGQQEQLPKAVYWNVVRPTCGPLDTHALAGPLLSGNGSAATANMAKYLQFVKDFNEQVYTNAEFISEMETQAAAIESAVALDAYGSSGEDYAREKTASAGYAGNFNLLAFMKARGEEVRKQLAAIDAGNFSQLEHQVPATEKCADWRGPVVWLDSGAVKTSKSSWYALTGSIISVVLISASF